MANMDENQELEQKELQDNLEREFNGNLEQEPQLEQLEAQEYATTKEIEAQEAALKQTVLGYIENRDIANLKRYLIEAQEPDILELVEDLDATEQAIVFRLLPKDEALYIFERLDVTVQERLIHALAEDQACELFEELAPDDRVSLLDEMPALVAAQMVQSLSKEERIKTNLLMGYEPETAGRIMTPDYISLRRQMTVKEAFSKVKKQAKDDDKETIYTLYVIDDGRRYEGRVTLRELIIADENQLIQDIMTTGIDAVSTSTDQEEVVRELQRLDLLSIPVVDKENRLVGIVTIDDALDILEEEATEDMLGKAKMKSSKKGDSSEALIKGNLWQVWKVRLPFLAFTIIGGLLSGLAMGGFEDRVIALVLPAVFFIPLVMDLGGTIGVQSSTIFIRGMTLGHVNTKKMGKHVVREIFIGMSIGAVAGLIVALIVFIWQGVISPFNTGFFGGNDLVAGLMLGIATWVAIIAVCTFAAFMGFTVPYVLQKLKVDQAAATGPVITTIKDVVGMSIYLGLVYLFVITFGA